jgi:hypothetical protein
VESIFTGGANAVISVVNAIIDAINLIPGVPDIEGVGKIGTGGGGWSPFQRGGELTGGKPSGDSIPALLERGEYVLNRKAVQQVGVDRLNQLNFQAASRFQTGGPVGMIGGGIVDAAKSVVGKVADTAMNGPGFFLDKLPKPEIPQPFTGVGPYLIKQVTEWIKSKVPKILGGGGSWSGGSGQYPGVSGDTDFMPALGMALSRMSKAAGQSIYVQSGWRSYAEQAALYEDYLNGTGNLAAPPGSSNHESGRAADITPGSEVFGSMASRFGLGFTVPGESWHIELLRRGGLVGLARMMKGGLAGAGHGLLRMMKGGEVAKIGARILTATGFDHRATAGILGNAWHESMGWNPSQMELTGYDNGGLFGFTTSPVSMADLRAYAAKKGKPWDDAATQYKFMLTHGQPTGRSLVGAMNSLDTIPETTEYFMDKWERPGVPALDQRIKGAFIASAIMRKMKLPGGKGSGPSPSEKRTSEREGIIEKLRKAVKKAGSPEARQEALWKLVGAWGRYGDFDKDSKQHVIEKVAKAARVIRPLGNIPVLQNLAGWLNENVGLSGEKNPNEDFVERMRKAARKGNKYASKKRKGILSEITGKGTDFPLKGKLSGNRGALARVAEFIDIAERKGSAEFGPGGSDLTDAELAEQVKLYTRQLELQRARRNMIARSLTYLRGVRENLAGMVKQAGKKGSPLAWKRGAFKKGLSNVNRVIKDEMKPGLVDMIGVTGKGGAIFDTKMRLKELGATTTAEGNRDAEMAALLREQLNVAQRNNAILTAQMPIYQQFMPRYHTGGIVAGQGEVPIMAQAGEGVFTRDQMKAMGGAQNITVIVEDGAVNSDRIRVEVDGVLAKHISGARRSTGGRKFVTNG